MMLPQFQARYPTGSLISELLTIYQGKFVVRVSAQVDGVTRATGMAASDSLELAEDQARSRALMVLGIQPATLAQSVTSAPRSAAVQVHKQPVETAFGLNHPLNSYVSQASPQEESTLAPAVSPGFKENSDAYGKESFTSNPWTPTHSAEEPDAAVENFGLLSGIQTGSSGNQPISLGNVTPLVPRNYKPQESQTSAETQIIESVPVDLSDAIARTTVELQRLGWSNKQGRDYLVRTYGKRSRQELTDEEMLEFLHYLESQPSEP